MSAPAVLAIDPGNAESAFALIDAVTLRPLSFGKYVNHDVMCQIATLSSVRPTVAIEMVASYGMAVGADVFETCVWVGRFIEQAGRSFLNGDPTLVYRRDIKVHHCGSARAKDSNVRQALIDRFGDKGTKANPGWFYGFKADVWQAYALAVYVADTAGHQGATQ